MKKKWCFVIGLFLCISLCGQTVVRTKAVGDVTLSCPDAGKWKIDMQVSEKNGCEEIRIVMDAPEETAPAKFDVLFECPQKDAHHLWHSEYRADRCQLKPNWGGNYYSSLAQQMPLYAFFNENNRNRLTVACSECIRMVNAKMGLREEGCVLVGSLSFFRQPEADIRHYEVIIRLDARDCFWAESVAEGAQWISDISRLEACQVPEAAFEPLYSTWYQFHQNVSDKAIEEECRLASGMGMKTIIVDDGWQTDDNNRGYAFCGDWKVSTRRFPDMAAHVRRVQDMGMKYMMWYSVPFMGEKSQIFNTFKGKFLFKESGDWWVLDPRFPEVREYLCGVYERALREWNIDGFKLDFIDRFLIQGVDPAIAENYKGRDIKSVPHAVDVLMKEVRRRLQAIKPDILIEFRQNYMGPAIRQFGNMMRAADCPGDLQGNRIRTSNLRLTSGTTAVHADMLEWHPAETPQDAARPILAVLYSTIQYSMMLRDLPESHHKVINHWLNFSQQHRETLLHGTFKPYHPESCYPLLEAESAQERILTAYQDGIVVPAGKPDKDVYVVNATGCAGVVIDLQQKPRSMTAYNVFGEKVKLPVPNAGLARVAVPASGYVVLNY